MNMDSQTEEIKSRLDVVDFIGQYVTLKKAGINYKGVCPFHNEKTPSFMVNKERQIYKCFGCGEGGDIFSFVMKIEGLDFVDALKMLAERAGVQLKARDPQLAKQQSQNKTRLLELNKVVADLYHQLLLRHKAGEHARQYIESRKINKKTITDFQIGYAPNNVRRVQDYLQKMGFSQADLNLAGNPENFRDRLMFPIADTLGNIVGFSGRALQKGQEPKYLNTRETPVFYKSKILYGLFLAKNSIREADRAIVVEGQMDVVSSYQAKTENVVATSGTALTREHLLVLRRHTNNIVFAFDNDEAGFKATIKAIEMAWSLGIQTSVVSFPADIKDAGEAVEKDPSAWRQVVDDAVPAFDWLWQKLSAGETSSTASKRKIAQTIVPLVAQVTDPVERDDYKRRLAQSLAVTERAIEESLGKINTQSTKPSEPEEQKQNKISIWLKLLALMHLMPDKIGEAETMLGGKITNGKVADVYEHVFKWYNESKLEKNKDFLNELPPKLAQEVVIVATMLENDEPDVDVLRKDFEAHLEKISKNIKDKIKADFAEKIAQAEREGSIEKMQNLLKELEKNK